jgi:hypothetical protein
MPQGCKDKANYEPIRLGENSPKENTESYDIHEEIVKEEGWGLEL